VDKSGSDAYLCVEYEWDTEFYVQDFGPQHVRRRGQKKTVFDIFNQSDDLEATRKANRGGPDLDATRKTNRDKGGGVSALLED